MNNPYKSYLKLFFETIINLRHSAYRIDKVLHKDLEKYTVEEAKFYSGSSLIISDWTGPTDNGWELNFHTGIRKETKKENYAIEVENILSRQFCFAYSQTYEAFEKFLKDCLYLKITTDLSFRNSLNLEEKFSRNSLKGGEPLFKILKKAGQKRFKDYSKKNNKNLRFKELFTVLSEVRHAITHSSCIIETSKILKSDYHSKVFIHLFRNNNLSEGTITIHMNYNMLVKLLKYQAEFGFQVYKILSEEDNYNWKINE